MRTYISVDLEGVAGISHPAPTGRGDMGYPAAVSLMVGEANAAIEGALAGGATEIVVNDSHGRMFNLLPSELRPEARLIQGQGRERMTVSLPGGSPQHPRARRPTP